MVSGAFTDNKTLMGIIAVLLVIFSIAVYSYNLTLNQLATGSCSDLVDCPHEKVLETQNIVIFALVVSIVAIAAWIAYRAYWKGEGKKESPAKPAESKPADDGSGDKSPVESSITPMVQPAARIEPDMSTMEPDEQKVIQLLREKEGSVFQSEINKATMFSKVKVSRILDRLEQRGLIERKRRGMANLVVLK